MILDIGPKTIEMIIKIIDNSKTILWNGPAGYFENPNFANGSIKIAKKIAENNKANKIYIANKGTDATKYVDIYIAALCIGRLYAGDWAFFPLEAAAATQDVGIEAISAAQVVEFALIHEGKTLVAS